MADHSQLLLLSITSFFLFISFSSSDDASVMSKLSASISPVPSSWKTEHNFCLWNDIACDESGRVIAILIASKSLTGTLPSELNTLSQLQRLSLGNNSLSGELPTLANLTRLVYAFLNSNNFTSIPSNFFLGLTNLKNFSISDNPHLSPWSIPYDLTQSTNLEAFEASNSNIAGSIPDIFDNFLNLRDLRLSYNNITGTLPATFGGSKIQNLWLDNQIQGLSGTIDVIASMTKLNQVWLQANAFTGVIPDLSKCIHLFNLQLRDNRLTGLVPNSLTSLRKLANITLQNNKLQGPVPIFESGVEFYISANSFCLPMPGNCDPQVTALLEVSRALGYPMSLAESWHGNNACDHWPFITCDPSGENVTSINFSNMKFSGTISPSLGNLTSLKSLSLKDNNITGSIPEILVSLTDLELLDLSNNNLSGRIPKFLTTVTILLDNNPFIGRGVHSGNIKPPAYASNSSVSGWRPPRHVLAGMVVGIVISLFIFGGIVWYVCYCW